jgi:hypothetical protein
VDEHPWIFVMIFIVEILTFCGLLYVFGS